MRSAGNRAGELLAAPGDWGRRRVLGLHSVELSQERFVKLGREVGDWCVVILVERFAEALDECVLEVGGNEVRLWVVESNTPAVRLYESAGFVPTGETQPLPSRPELTDVRMRLALD